MIQMLNSAGAAWGEFFLLAVIQNSIFLGLVFTALHLLRNAPARVRYLVALTGLIKLVLPPFMRIPALLTIPENAAGGYGNLIPFVTGSSGGSVAAISTAAEQGLTPAGAILGIWAIVVVMGLIFSVASSVRLALKLRGALSIDAGDIPKIPGIENIRILRSGRIAMPITVAFLPGRIYVPGLWDSWTPSCRRMVLMHEMAHLKRHDGIILIMQIIARAIYFFHPLVALLDRRLSEYREMACDDATVGRDRDSGVEYSRYLVEIAESVVRCPAVCGSASALIRRKNELLRRVSYQLEEGRMRSISRTRMMILAAAIVLLAVSLSWYRGNASTESDVPLPPAQPAVPALPVPPAQENPGKIRQVNVLLKSGGAKIDDRKVSMEELAAALELFGGKDPENVVVRIVCADDVPMSDVRIVQETMIRLGIMKISYVNSEGEGFPLQLPPQKAIERLEELPEAFKIDVVVGKDGIVVGTRNVSADDLQGVIEAKLEETPMAVVVVRCDREMDYEDFTRVMKILNKAGADRVNVTFVEGK